MQLSDFNFDDWAVKLAGVAGAAVSMNFIKGPLPRRLALATCGLLISTYLAGWTSHKTGLPEGAAGFLIALFGMSIVARAWEFVEAAPIGAIWQAGLDRIKGKP